MHRNIFLYNQSMSLGFVALREKFKVSLELIGQISTHSWQLGKGICFFPLTIYLHDQKLCSLSLFNLLKKDKSNDYSNDKFSLN